MNFPEEYRDLFRKKRNKKIRKACLNVCSIFFNEKPVNKNKNEKKMTEKCTDLMPGGLHEHDEILCEFAIGERRDIFGAIILPDAADIYDEIARFNINFYEVKENERPEMFHMVKFFTGEDSEMIIHGNNPEEITIFKRELELQARGKKYTTKIRSNSNKKKLFALSGAVFVIACTAFFFKEHTSFKKPFQFFHSV